MTLGVFILWLGWFGFNGGSVLALGDAASAVAMSNVLANTNLAAAAGVMAAISTARPLLGRVDLLAGLNGAIAGLVAITAGPDIVDHYWAIVIGAIGGVICTAGIKLMETMKLDDVVGAVPAHLFAGVWGTLAVCIAAGGSFVTQLVGVLAVGVFVFAASWILWLVLEEDGGGAGYRRRSKSWAQDTAELGIEAYPEFMLMPDQGRHRGVAARLIDPPARQGASRRASARSGMLPAYFNSNDRQRPDPDCMTGNPRSPQPPGHPIPAIQGTSPDSAGIADASTKGPRPGSRTGRLPPPVRRSVRLSGARDRQE